MILLSFPPRRRAFIVKYAGSDPPRLGGPTLVLAFCKCHCSVNGFACRGPDRATKPVSQRVWVTVQNSPSVFWTVRFDRATAEYYDFECERAGSCAGKLAVRAEVARKR